MNTETSFEDNAVTMPELQFLANLRKQSTPVQLRRYRTHMARLLGITMMALGGQIEKEPARATKAVLS